MTRAEELAKAYEESLDYYHCMNDWPSIAYSAGYEQAEKDTIERAVTWLKDNANKYIVDLTETYPDAPVNIIVGGKCWEDLKEYIEKEQA